MTHGVDLASRLLRIVQRQRGVAAVRLTGSRARGDANELSDWDLDVTVDDADRFERDVSVVAEQLGAISWGREPLGAQRAVVLLLPGPARADLLLVGHTQRPAEPWAVTADSLPAIDHHFWQRILWLGSKVLRGDGGLVTGALAAMHRHILRPLGAPVPPASVEEAIDRYREAVVRVEDEKGTRLDRRLDALVGSAVLAALGHHAGERLAGRGTIREPERE